MNDDQLLLRSPLRNVYHLMYWYQKFTYENWIWAFTMLFSRAIRLRSLKEGEALAMVPYADLINHSPFSQAYIDAREGGDWLFSSGEEEVILYADRGYRRMEQVRIDDRNSRKCNILQPLKILCQDLHFLWSQIERGTSTFVWFRCGTKSFQLGRPYGGDCTPNRIICQGAQRRKYSCRPTCRRKIGLLAIRWERQYGRFPLLRRSLSSGVVGISPSDANDTRRHPGETVERF